MRLPHQARLLSPHLTSSFNTFPAFVSSGLTLDAVGLDYFQAAETTVSRYESDLPFKSPSGMT